MASKDQLNIISSVDIGTSKVASVIARVLPDQTLEIIGFGSVPSEGVRRGTIVNIEAVSSCVAKAVEEAEIMAGTQVQRVYASLSGAYTEGINTKSVIAITNKNREITDSDIKRAIDAATERVVPIGREVLHVIPQQYVVDDQEGIKDPRGMNGTRLEVYVRVINTNVTSLQNVIKAINKAGFSIEDFILGSIGAGEVVLTEEEKDLGVILLDIGAGITNIVGYYNGSVWYTGSVPLGGIDITSDISNIFRSTIQHAEKIKKLYGNCIPLNVLEDEVIEIQLVNKRVKVVRRRELAEVIQARVDEILEACKRNLRSSGMLELANAGVVVTGGGAILQGIDEEIENIFDMPCRVGYVDGISTVDNSIKNPSFSTAVGLIVYPFKKGNVILSDKPSNGISVLHKIKSFINDLFFGE